MNRSGLATLVCIALIGTTAAVLTAVSGRADQQVQRTRLMIDEAQASQLLRAGWVIASEAQRLGQWKSGPVPCPVGQLRVTWDESAPNERRCTIDASVGHVRRTVDCDIGSDGTLRLHGTPDLR